METDFDLEISGAAKDLSAGDHYDALGIPSLLESQARNVELLSHLAAYSELLVAVTGPEGSGKSVIANALAAQRELPEDTLFLTASVMMGMPALLAAIANHWDLPVVSEDSAQVRESLRSEALKRAEDGGGLLVIIDQADQLDTETLNDIAHFALLAPHSIAFALFGLPGYEGLFRMSPAQAPVHTLEIESLTDSEVKRLIAMVFGDGDVCPLSDKEISQLTASTTVYPGNVIDGAERILAAGQGSAATTKGGFPLRNILALAGLSAVVAMLLLYQMGVNDIGADAATDEGLASETAMPSADYNYPEEAATGETDAGKSIPEVSLPERVVSTIPDTAPVRSIDSVSSESLSAQRQSSEAQAAETVSASASGNEESQPAAKAEQQDAQPVAQEVDVRTAESSSSTQSTDDAAPDTPVAADTLKEMANETSDSADVDFAKASVVSASDAQAATSSATPVPAYTPDEQALLTPSDGFIVQLLGTRNADGATAFIRRRQSEVTGSLYQYQTSYQGQPWHVVVSGVYGSRAEAVAAVNAMPADLRRQSPWIRPVGDVQNVIR